MYKSFTLNGEYRAQKSNAEVHKDATNIQEFDSFEDLAASPEYIAYQEAKAAEQATADYANLDKIVKQKQVELGMDLSKEGLVQNGVLLHTILQTPIPEKTQAAFDWLQDLWQAKYFTVNEGDIVTFDDVEPLNISYAEIAAELGF
jgi:hypothetical protein